MERLFLHRLSTPPLACLFVCVLFLGQNNNYYALSIRSGYPEHTCKLKMDVQDAADSEAAQVLHYRQRLEKSTGGEVKLMEWSPTMDLLAVAMADHSVRSLVVCCNQLFHSCFRVKVVLNRLSWQRVWTIPSATTLVTAITWRPDGRGKKLPRPLLRSSLNPIKAWVSNLSTSLALLTFQLAY